MAVSPYIFNKEFLQEVNKFEEYVDNELCKKTISEDQKIITIDIPKNLSKLHANVLIPRYLNVGWTDVTYNSDSNGDTKLSWLNFYF